MAWKGQWGCYIHIPRTSGTWTRRVLSQKGGEKDGTTHQLPQSWAHPLIFTTVRVPHEWLRSVFVNRRNARWKEHGEECPWRYFAMMIAPYGSNDFDEFIDGVTTNLPGVVGWLYGCYTPPGVKVLRYGEENHKFLAKLGCHPERQMPVNVSGKKPELLPKTHDRIYKAEMLTYARYGYFQDGSHL